MCGTKNVTIDMGLGSRGCRQVLGLEGYDVNSCTVLETVLKNQCLYIMTNLHRKRSSSGMIKPLFILASSSAEL